MLDLIASSAGAILLHPATLGALVLGVLVGFVAGIIPGIGGRIGLLLALPLALAFDPFTGGVFLLALHAVVHTSGSITPIAYGLPTSASEAATAIDGFALQKKGRGAEALGASLSASVIGGVIGAIVFIAVVPLVRPIVTSFGAPEFLMLALLGLSLVATVSDRQIAGGVAVAALGVLASTVGLDALTGIPRFTFGRLELWDGLQLVSVIGGLFVVPEMLSVAASETPRPVTEPIKAHFRAMIRGMATALRHRLVLARSTAIGIVVGMMPGVGSSVAVWIAYADAARKPPADGIPFGEGAIAGVIAPEAANNAKEGGALIPTIYFGIPGSSAMAILLGGFAMLGIEPGPQFLGPQLATAASFAWVVALANILTIPIFLLSVPLLVGVTAPRPTLVAPFALIAIVTATLAAGGGLFGLAEFAIGGLLGVLLKLAGLPRAPFLLGFVMGPIAETSLGKTIAIFGFDALRRPGVIILGVAMVAVIARMRRPVAIGAAEGFSRSAATATFAGMIALGLAAIVVAQQYSDSASLAPVAASAIMAGAAAFSVFRLARRKGAPPEPMALDMGLRLAASIAVLPVIGLIPASVLFLLSVRQRIGSGSMWTLGLAILAVVLAQFLFFEGLLGIRPEFGLFEKFLS